MAAEVLLDIIEELVVAAENDLGELVVLVPGLGRFGQCRGQRPVVAEGAVKPDRVIRVVGAAVKAAEQSEEARARGVEVQSQAPLSTLAVLRGEHHQDAAAIRAFPPAGAQLLHPGEGISALVVDAAAEITDARSRQQHRQGRLLRRHVAAHRAPAGQAVTAAQAVRKRGQTAPGFVRAETRQNIIIERLDAEPALLGITHKPLERLALACRKVVLRLPRHFQVPLEIGESPHQLKGLVRVLIVALDALGLEGRVTDIRVGAGAREDLPMRLGVHLEPRAPGLTARPDSDHCLERLR